MSPLALRYDPLILYVGSKMVFGYIFKHYAKRYFLFLIALSSTFSAIDYFQHIHRLPEGVNVTLLYIYYVWQESLTVLYPLVFLLSLLSYKLSLAKENTLVALYALGYENRQIFLPIAIFIIALHMIFILLQATPFAYAKEKADFILKHQVDPQNLENLFFKYDQWFIYAKRLDPKTQTMHALTLFKVENDKVIYTLHAPKAVFDTTHWIVTNAVRKRHVYQEGELIRYEIQTLEHIKTLEGYKPEIIRSFYEGKGLNLIDAIESWLLLRSQQVQTDKLKTYIYAKTLVPFFALALGVVLFYRIPYHARMLSYGKVISLSLLLIFGVWGMFFWLEQLSKSGTLSAEAGIILPLFALFVISFFLTRPKRHANPNGTTAKLNHL